MKRKTTFLLVVTAGISCLSAACQTGNGEKDILEPSLQNEQVFETSSEEPSVQAEKTYQQILAEQPSDENHDAFLVDTGGTWGTMLVTAEWENQQTIHFAVWNPEDMDVPVQTMDKESWCFRRSTVIDANFDGYMDFSYTYAMGNQPYYDHLWIWDENQGQFVYISEFDEISVPCFDTETETIYGFSRSSGAGTGLHTFHRWVDGQLVCMRRIEIEWSDQPDTIRISVQDRTETGLTEVVYCEDFPVDTKEWLDRQLVWYDLNYHGESDGP